MLNRTGVAVLSVVAVAGVAVAIVASRGGSGGVADSKESAASSSGGKVGAPVFPDLGSRTADVSQIVVKRAPMEFTIKKDGDIWRVVEKAGYPAKIDTVRSVVVGLSQLIREEEKTSRPEQYSKLGVEDPVAPPPDAADKPVPQSAMVTLKDDAGKAIASAVLGNPKYAGQGVGGTTSPQMFVRPAGEKAAWLVSGNVELPREPIGWMESKFADIKRDRIKSVVITHADGSSVTVSRDKQADAFAVRDIPAGRELKDVGVGESIASALTGLAFQDVGAASLAAPPPAGADPATTEVKAGPTIVVRTFDGLVVTVKSVSKEAKAWWTLTASVDESLAIPTPAPATPATPPAPATADAKPADNPTAATPPGAPGTPPAPATGATPPAVPAPASPLAAPAVGTLEALKKEAAELNAAWAPYAFAPVDWKAKSINSTMADLLKDPTPPTPPTAPGALPAGAPAPNAPPHSFPGSPMPNRKP